MVWLQQELLDEVLERSQQEQTAADAMTEELDFLQSALRSCSSPQRATPGLSAHCGIFVATFST